MFVGSGSPKKPSLFVVFSFLSENVSKWRGSSKSDFRCFFDLFLIGRPLGAPGFIFLDFWAPRASFWHLFGCPGHHFGTLGAPPVFQVQWKLIFKPTWLSSFCWILKSLGFILAPLGPIKHSCAQGLSECNLFLCVPVSVALCSTVGTGPVSSGNVKFNES